jgi:hypothetical protein
MREAIDKAINIKELNLYYILKTNCINTIIGLILILLVFRRISVWS